MPDILSAVAPAPKARHTPSPTPAEPKDVGAGNEFRDAMRKATDDQNSAQAASSDAPPAENEAAPTEESAPSAAATDNPVLPASGMVLPPVTTVAPVEADAATAVSAAAALTRTAAASETAAALVQAQSARVPKEGIAKPLAASVLPAQTAVAHPVLPGAAPESPITASVPAPTQSAPAVVAQPVVWDAELIRASKEIMPVGQQSDRLPSMESLAPASTMMPQLATARTSTPGAPLSTAVDVGFRQPGWGDAFASRLTWVVKQDVQNAEIRLNPAHLGPVEIKVSVHQDQASVTLSAHHAAVREAMESTIPKLREMLADSGINLTSVSVAQQFSGNERRAPQQSAEGFSGASAEESPDHDNAALSATAVKLGVGVLDLYA